STARIAAGHLLRGQTNFVKMLWKFNSVYNPNLQMADHARPVIYQMPLPPGPAAGIPPHLLYIHRSQGRTGRVLDDATEQFVETTRMRSTGSPSGPSPLRRAVRCCSAWPCQSMS